MNAGPSRLAPDTYGIHLLTVYDHNGPPRCHADRIGENKGHCMGITFSVPDFVDLGQSHARGIAAAGHLSCVIAGLQGQ